MICIRCRHNAEVERLREICSKCRLGDGCAVSGTFSLDSMSDGALGSPGMRARPAPCARAADWFDPGELDEPAEGPFDAEERTARDAFTTILCCIAQLRHCDLPRLALLARLFDGIGSREFGLVRHLLDGGTTASYARAEGISRQAAHARFRALFRRRPAFMAAANSCRAALKAAGKGGARGE